MDEVSLGPPLDLGSAHHHTALNRIAALRARQRMEHAMSDDPTRFSNMANAIRALSMDAVQAANSGHPGMPMGMADVATVLWLSLIHI